VEGIAASSLLRNVQPGRGKYWRTGPEGCKLVQLSYCREQALPTKWFVEIMHVSRPRLTALAPRKTCAAIRISQVIRGGPQVG
jgi:hypothetical protein